MTEIAEVGLLPVGEVAELRRPYKMWHSPATVHAAEAWLVDGESGFGFRTFPTENRAMEAIEEYFGEQPDAIFEIRLFDGRTAAKFKVAKGCKRPPEELLLATMEALNAEKSDLQNCPMHARQPDPRVSGLVEALEEVQAYFVKRALYGPLVTKVDEVLAVVRT